METKATRFIDRSRVLSFMRCPRERFLNYHFKGRGITTNQLRVPLLDGTHIHGGLEGLLSDLGVEAAVESALTAYHVEADRTLSAMSTHLDHYDYTVAEQAALVEALIRVYALGGLPRLLEEYRVVEVESEYTYELQPGQTMMSRLDSLLEKLSDSREYVLSFKTDTGAGLDSKIADARLDLQGLTEPLARLMSGKPLPDGVKMEWLIKGQWKEEVKGSGLKYQDSYLVRPYSRNLGVVGSTTEWAWKYFTPCLGEKHKIMGANAREWTCAGKLGTTHGLGDSWARVPIWQQMPIKEWIAILADGRIQPGAGDPIAESLYLPAPIFRKEVDVWRALRAIQSQERDIDKRLENTQQHETSYGVYLMEALDVAFPTLGAFTGQCLHSFGGVCQFATLCHNADPQAALLHWEEQGFKYREPHHEGEREALGITHA